MHLTEKGYEFGQPDFQKGRKPLYNIHNCFPQKPDEEIFLVEGEKCADILISKGILAITSGGAESGSSAYFHPLAGRRVVIWPDNDKAGRGYADCCGTRLKELGCTVELIDVEALGLPEKGDVYDWLRMDASRGAVDVLALPRKEYGASPIEEVVELETESNEPKVITLPDFLKLDLPEREYLLAPWLPRQGLTMIHAYRGVGKTYVALNIAVAVASGGSLFGWNAPAPASVLYLDGEMSARSLQERLAQIVQSNEVGIPERLRIMTPDLQPKGRPHFNLYSTTDQELLEPFLEGCDLLIIDNLATIASGGKLNDAESWRPVQDWILGKRAAGLSILFIHHSGKNGGQRGTSAKEDVLDTVIGLKRPGDYSPSEGARFEVHFEKARSFSGDDSEPLECKMTIDPSGNIVWDYAKVQDTLFQRVVDLAEEGLSQTDIAAEVGKHKSTISRMLKRAREEGLLEAA
ncbi:MAG: AAA family ATPase [Gammaproteobacteria bacterium]|nr:AAA family ATPase [Gammaproteobacteria bacterium]